MTALDALRALVDALPRCEYRLGDEACREPALWRLDNRRGYCAASFCDRHSVELQADEWSGFYWPEALPHAAALRDALRVLAAEGEDDG